MLLRRTRPDHPHQQVAVRSVERLLASREQVHFTLQNIAEFWNVATPPAEHNGLGFTVAMVRAQIELIEDTLELLPDTPTIYQEWKRLEPDPSARYVHLDRRQEILHII